MSDMKPPRNPEQQAIIEEAMAEINSRSLKSVEEAFADLGTRDPHIAIYGIVLLFGFPLTVGATLWTVGFGFMWSIVGTFWVTLLAAWWLMRRRNKVLAAAVKDVTAHTTTRSPCQTGR